MKIGKPNFSIKARLFTPLLVLLIPMILIQAYISYNRFTIRRSEELQANFELARAVGIAFHSMVQAVLREELAISVAATASPHLSNQDFTRLLRQSAEGDSAVSRFSWIAPDGRVLASSNQKIIGINVSDRPYFRAILAGRNWTISDIVTSKATGEKVFTICRAARDRYGKFLGMVGATFFPDGMDKILSIKRTKDAWVYLFDHNGMNVDSYPASAKTEQRYWLKLSPWIEPAIRGKEVSTTILSAINGEKELMGFVPIPSIGWVAAAGQHQNDAMGDFTNTMLTQSLLFLFVALSAFITALVIARQAAGSIRSLRDQVLALGWGGMKNAVNVSGPSEILELADAFNRMAEDVRSREKALMESEKRASQTAAEANESRARLQALFDSAPLEISLFDAAGTLVYTTPTGLRMHGFASQDDFRMRLDRLEDALEAYTLDGRQIPFSEWPFARSLRGETVQGLEMKLHNRVTGQSWIGLIHATPVLDRSGAVTSVVIFNQDITSIKEAEAALWDANAANERHLAQLNTLFNQLTEGLMIFDSEGRILDINPAARAILGFEDTSHLKNHFSQLTETFELFTLEGKSLPYEEWPVSRMLRGEAFESYEVTVRRKDNGKTWIGSYSGNPVRNHEGKCWLSILSLRDVTEQRRLEQALTESEDLFHQAFDLAPIGMVLIAPDGRFERINAAYCRITGYSEEELLQPDFDFQRLTHPEDLERNVLGVGSLVSGEIPAYFVEKRYIRKDGGIVWVQASASLRRDKNGRPFQIVGLAEDITRRKEAEAALQRARDELEERVRERTAELERRNRELQEFTYVAAHDLTEPLRKIQTFGSLLEQKSGESLGVKEKDYIFRMSGAAKRMQALLRDLLNYSRLERDSSDFVPVSMNSVLQDTVDDLEVTIRETAARVEISALPTILGDANQLRQLFQNLIANAVKYRRPAITPNIRIYSEENKDTVHIFVEDNGIGFDEKYMDKIFQPFQRLHSNKEYTGTGIGLAICRKIVEKHGGTITAKSIPGKGSKFLVTLIAKRNR